MTVKKTCLLIPGNPAIAGYYHTWMDEIVSQNKNLNMVYATSYVLFDRKLNYTEYDRAMRGHYERILLELSATEKIVILAHSVGCYFALRLLEKYPERIENIIIIFPYIGYSTIKSLKLLPALYMIDRVLPLAELVSRHKNLFQKLDKDVHNISNSDLTACLRFGIRQCTYFEKYKFEVNSILHHKDKIHLIYTENDKWCPTEAIELLKTASTHKRSDLPHDFILNKDQRIKMVSELSLVD